MKQLIATLVALAVVIGVFVCGYMFFTTLNPLWAIAWSANCFLILYAGLASGGKNETRQHLHNSSRRQQSLAANDDMPERD